MMESLVEHGYNINPYAWPDLPIPNTAITDRTAARAFLRLLEANLLLPFAMAIGRENGNVVGPCAEYEEKKSRFRQWRVRQLFSFKGGGNR